MEQQKLHRFFCSQLLEQHKNIVANYRNIIKTEKSDSKGTALHVLCN